MGGLAEQAVDRACQAYIDRDLARCHAVLEGETLINATEREIDELAFDLLAMQQPMAVDLRFILAVTKSIPILNVWGIRPSTSPSA